jgi:hypothetical protein
MGHGLDIGKFTIAKEIESRLIYEVIPQDIGLGIRLSCGIFSRLSGT